MANRQVMAIVDLALAEDLGAGDITTLSTVGPEVQAAAAMIAKQAGTIYGLAVASAVFRRVDPAIEFRRQVDDGSRVEAMTGIAAVLGAARSILMAERVALNFIQRLSGVATMTATYMAAIAGTGARLVDTRKTTPGMRVLEKEAVLAGGGHNHRFGLSDGILIKDNHLAAVGGADRIGRAISMARAHAPHTLKIEVEVTTLAEVEEALAAGADVIMLDNMAIAVIAEAVRLAGGRALLEASGGITLDTLAEVAGAGVDFISVGALTHSAPSLDISLDFEISPIGSS